jgi:hypothetical protein
VFCADGLENVLVFLAVASQWICAQDIYLCVLESFPLTEPNSASAPSAREPQLHRTEQPGCSDFAALAASMKPQCPESNRSGKLSPMIAESVSVASMKCRYLLKGAIGIRPPPLISQEDDPSE